MALRTSLDPMSELKASGYVLPSTQPPRAIGGRAKSPRKLVAAAATVGEALLHGPISFRWQDAKHLLASGSMSLTASGTSQREGASAEQPG